MRTFDRMMIAALALGVWALVLKPDVISAQGKFADRGHVHPFDRNYADSKHDHDHGHNCRLSGNAFSDGHLVYDWRGVKVTCD